MNRSFSAHSLQTRFALRASLLTLLLLFASQAPTQAASRVLAFGDSVTQGQGADGVDCRVDPPGTTFGGYPRRLETRLQNRGVDADVVNFGLCGERTSSGVTRIDSVLATGGDVILIMEGTNDFTPSCCVSFQTILFNLDQMVQKARAAGIEPVLASVVPIEDPEGNESAETLAGVLQQFTTAAFYADPYNAMIDVPDLFENFYSDSLHPNGPGYGLVADAFVEPTIAALTCPGENLGTCTPGPNVLCLNGGRFRVSADARDFEGVAFVGQAEPQTDDTGAFWFFDPNNIEVVIKVLDGRMDNDFFWVFYGSLSDVEFTIDVVDTENRTCKRYRNSSGSFASVGDTAAFFDPL